MKEFEQIIKQVLCVILSSVIFIIGCPEIFNSNILGNVTVYAAEEWKTKLKNTVDGIDRAYGHGSSGVQIKDADISSCDFETINAYLFQLLNTENYFWLEYLMVEKNEDYTYLYYKVKEKYINQNNGIDKQQAKKDYKIFSERLERGELQQIIEERVGDCNNYIDDFLAYGYVNITDLYIYGIKEEEIELCLDNLNNINIANGDYYWILRASVSSYSYTEFGCDLSIRCKAKYLSNGMVDVSRAKSDFLNIQNRYRQGEWKEVIAEEIIENAYVNGGFISVDINYLDISADKYNELMSYLVCLADKNPHLYFMDSFGGKLNDSNPSKLSAVYGYIKKAYNECDNSNIREEAIKDYYLYKGRIASITSQFDNSMSSLEKVLDIYQFVMRECEYDYTNYVNKTVPDESYYPEGLLYNGLAVCSGYARTISRLLSICEINHYNILNPYIDHEWNIVELEGNNYHLDSTWDDGGKDDWGEGVSSVNYFLRSDEEFSKDHGYSASSTVQCNDSNSFENYIFRKSGTRQYSYYDTYWYYIKNNKQIIKSKIDGTDERVFLNENYINDSIVNMFIYKNYMYIATTKMVYKIDMKNTNNRTVIFNIASEKDFGNIDEFVIKQDVIKIDDDKGNTKKIEIPILSKVSLKDKELVIEIGDTYASNIDCYSELGNAVEWASADPCVVSVDENGKLTARAQGTATIYAGVDGVVSTIKVTVKNKSIYGDANSDGVVNSKDVVMMKKHLAGYAVDINLDACDVNGDNTVNSKDVVLVMKKLAGYDVVLGS